MLIDFSKTGKELFDQLIANKTELIAQKKAVVHKSDGVRGMPDLFVLDGKTASKTSVGDIPKNADSIRATIVANTAYWMDSQDDVLLPGNWDASINAGKGRLHLVDHTFKMNAEVGVVAMIYKKQMALTEFGLSMPGTTEALIYESDVKKEYDVITFNKYKNGRVNQHSISLQYVRITMAVNDPDYKEEYAEWQKHIENIINKGTAEKRGYFFPVYEIKLIEVSAVLLGSNELTPTLEVKSIIQTTPPQSTSDEPTKGKDYWAGIIADKTLLKNF